MRIKEIYRSVQGETQYAGLPCTLVRTVGCDLRCSWCDTPAAFHGGEAMTVDQVVERVEELATDLVLLTGGEPLLQRDLPSLAARLLALGHTVMVETGGHIDVGDLPEELILIVDVKCPSSGEAGSTICENLSRLGSKDAVKFVVADATDYEYARRVIDEYGFGERLRCQRTRDFESGSVNGGFHRLRCHRPLHVNPPCDFRSGDPVEPYHAGPEVLLSPVHGALNPRELVAWMLRDGLHARLNLQLHKYVWGADAQGV